LLILQSIENTGSLDKAVFQIPQNQKIHKKLLHHANKKEESIHAFLFF